MRVATRYFVVRIPKDEQQYKRENAGSFFVHPNLVFFARNTQCGEIVCMGDLAKKNFPQAKEGMIMLMHHFVEGSLDKRNERNSLVKEDDDFKYYVVSGAEIPGTRMQAYGVFDGEKIIPHKDYIFLEVDQPKEKEEHDLFDLPEYEESTERTLADLKKIKEASLRMAKNKMTSDVKTDIEKKDKRRENITLNFHKKEYQKYNVAFSANPEITKYVFALNVACNTIVDFLGKSYRVAESKYISLF